MLSFPQNVTVQSAHTIETPVNKDFEQRLGNLMNRLGQPQDQELQPTEPPSATSASEPFSSMGTALAELSSIAGQLAHVDLMIAQVTDGVPEEDEAKRFQEISIRALKLSRDMLCQKQARYLAQIGSVVDITKSPPAMEDPFGPEPDSETPRWMGWGKAEVEACPEFVPSLKPNVAGGSLRQDLEFLRECCPECVIIVRKIKKLGFDSPKYLEDHFVQYGEVSKILVAHSHVKPTSKRPNGRVRPAALGFVVMADEQGVRRALEAGQEQSICDNAIELSLFDAFEDVEKEAWDKFQ